MNNFFNFDEKLMKIVEEAEVKSRSEFDLIEKNLEYNSNKVLSAFIKNRVSESSLKGSTGYGYGDVGREITDRVFADSFGAEDALVRHNFVSGTHALSVALNGILRPNDTLLSVTGTPYDTLEEVIGIKGESGKGSLKDFGVKYEELALTESGEVNFLDLAEKSKTAKVAYIQRSRGYSLRPTLDIDTIKKVVEICKNANPKIIVMVDNCYGEFVEEYEPTEVGADLIVGSLIKNPGGGIASTGGYIAGRTDLVELCSYRLTCVGMGKEVGCTLNQTREMLLGFFLAPQTVANALKTSVFACNLFTLLGYECYPKSDEKRSDIISAILLKDEATLTAFCEGIQKGSPVDSFVTPEAWEMPGYESKVIMAAGAFTMGASIELSADAPIRDPYAVWMQGGITYNSGKTGVILAAQQMIEKNIIVI